jgi:DNA-binding LacI/PurR family transcriptional regulator
MAVTINEIAQLARVSKSTVSRVLNKSGPVSKKTAEAVRHAIKSVDYRPNVLAQSLTLKKTRTVSLIVRDIRNPFFSNACWYAERFFRQHGYLAIICNTNNDSSLEAEMIGEMEQRHVDGVLCIGGNDNTSDVANVSGGNIPVVMVDRYTNNRTYSSVNLDNVYGGQLAVDYLFSLGHRKIAFATSGASRAERDRLEGYVVEHRNRGVAVDHTMIVTLDERMWHDGELNGILRIFSTDEKPTALFASNDFKAMKILRLFKKNYIQVPGDISIIGFDDIDIAASVHPALTTVHQPIDKMVEFGATLLLERIRGVVSSPNKTSLMPWLVERESTKKVSEKSHR